MANTSNLYRHPEVYSRVENKRPSLGKHDRPEGQPSLSEAWQKTQTFLSSSQKYKELTKPVTYCLTKDMFPISTVDRPGFKPMLQKFNHLPSRNYFTRVLIPALVSEVRGAIELVEDWRFFSGTADLWTSTADHPYLTFTCHFIDYHWELQLFCLQMHCMPEDHTAANIQDTLSETL